MIYVLSNVMKQNEKRIQIALGPDSSGIITKKKDKWMAVEKFCSANKLKAF